MIVDVDVEYGFKEYRWVVPLSPEDFLRWWSSGPNLRTLVSCPRLGSSPAFEPPFGAIEILESGYTPSNIRIHLHRKNDSFVLFGDKRYGWKGV
jgi:hypothetical protein